MRIIPIILTLLLFALSWVKLIFATSSSIVINEIAYDLPGNDTGREWVEIYNNGNEEVIIIGGLTNNAWRINDGNNRTLSATATQGSMTIPPNGFAIIAQKADTFLLEYPNFSGTIIQSSALSLNNTAGTIGLRIGSNGEIFGSVSYQNTQGADGDSNSLQRNSDNTWFVNIPTPGAQNTPAASPIPSSTPAYSLTPTPATTPSPSPKPTSSFIISGIPPQINSNQSFEVSVDLTLPNNKNTDYYLSGAFKKVDGTRYFSLTKINSSWVQYSSVNYLNQYKITTDDNGDWAGTLEVKPDTEDSDYKGTGEYTFKVAKYSSNTNPSWSNESNINITTATSTTQTPSVSPSPSSASLASSNSNTPTTTKALKLSNRPVKNATVAGAAIVATYSASPAGQISIKAQKQVNPIVWIGLFFIFAGLSLIGYIYLKKNGKISI